MLDKNILVLGSKPESKLPDIHVDKIYTANGAAARAIDFRKKHKKNELTCVVGAREFARNDYVSTRVIKSKPERIMIVPGAIDLPSELRDYTKLICLSDKEQWNFQAKFFKNKKISLLIAEMQHQVSFYSKIIHILKHIKNRNIQGISRGFYSILLALEENPNSNIIISGIGMKGGKQFYESKRSQLFIYDSRARVDRYLVNKLLENYKNRLYSLDSDLIDVSNIKKWNGSSF
ncbi:hypothetical protein N9J95_02525 [Candidatus Pelagibacter sp.]|nr:hypothetical protein [Candidatus Pelagibacter sp.]